LDSSSLSSCAPLSTGRIFLAIAFGNRPSGLRPPFSHRAHPIRWQRLLCPEIHLRPYFAPCIALLSLLFPVLHRAAAQTHPASPAPPLAGTYAGTLQAGAAQLHLVLHLTQDSKGLLHGSLDSLDQGVYDIEATRVSKSQSMLTLDVASVGAHFEGRLSADRKTIDGSWTQGTATLPLVFHRHAANTAPYKAKDAVFPVEGIWQTALETHGMRLRLQLHVSHDTERELIAALDSLDQGVSGLPANNVNLEETSFHFEVPAVAGTFDGKFDSAKNTLTGSWSQTGAEAVLEFKRSDEPLALRRPQNPSPPYPYREESVLFSNTAASVQLAGTLTLPTGPGPFPVAILIAGSGPHDRNENLASHKPFLVLADHLTRRGIAVLRYDKRGIGGSSGSVDNATTLDFAADTQAAIAYLKTRKDINAKKIGLIGHSEGAMIAPYVANHSPDVAWVVLLAAPSTNGEATLINQSSLIGQVGGLSEEQLLVSLTFDRAAYDIARKEKDPAVVAEKVKKLVKDSGLDAALPPEALETQLRMLTSPWFRFFLDYDPLPVLQALKTPALALYGQKDLQVPAKFNSEATQQALQSAGNNDFTVREMPELNHLFQHAYSGSPTEYAAIEESVAPEALQIISDWVVQHASS
jgi:pimeloyl-ACP methyl ester carboxylesterase